MDIGLVFKQGDWVLISVFLLLMLMSVTTWYIIIVRTLHLVRAKRSNRLAQASFADSGSLNHFAQQVDGQNAPMGDLAVRAIRAKSSFHAPAQGTALDEFLLRHIRNNMTQILRRFEGGLTALASIGATAPFVGLFGTVWGIYHALINISRSGQMNIAAVAGPIGEALVATAAGLFVAIPAVLAYNAISRGNKNLRQDMDAFAHDLYARLLKSGE